ncbi:MAG: carbon-nitrogen hydrolase family protein [Planctomycetota bacterium]
MRVAAVQCAVSFGDIDANVERVCRWIDQAAAQGAEIVVFPECVLTGYAFDDRESACEIAVESGDQRLRPILELVKAKELWVTLGTLQIIDASDRDEKNRQVSPRLHNAAWLIGPDGLEATYHKIHLPHLGVDRFVDRGRDGYAVSDAGGAKIGMAICYDCSFPEPMRVLGLHQADIVALGTNWPSTAARTAEVVPPARSMENHYYFIAANRVGEENGFTFCGRSSICGPDGVVLAKASNGEELLVTEIDLETARSKRIERTVGAHVIDRFADRRPEFYGDIL